MTRCMLSFAFILICYMLLLNFPAPVCAQNDQWVTLDDFEGTGRIWQPDGGPAAGVKIASGIAFAGQRSLAVTLVDDYGRNMVRQSWGADISDYSWSPDSYVRFWIKGSKLAHQPHGGVIFFEPAGQANGGVSHWMLDIDIDTYADDQWHQITLGPLSSAITPEWSPDADGKINYQRLSKILFVAQQDEPDKTHVPYTIYMDQLEVSDVEKLLPVFADAQVETAPAHVTPIWRGFQGRDREFPAQVTFTDVTGWKVGMYGGAEAVMLRSEEEPCHEDLKYQAKLNYRSPDGGGWIELIPPAPIPAPEKFNAACAWVYGNNWSWVPDPNTPPVNVHVRVLDATGQRHQLDMGDINFKFYGFLTKRLWDRPGSDPRHRYWGGENDGVIHQPAVIEAVEIHGNLQSDWRTIYLESVALFQDDMELPEFYPERIENLPFPTTPDTILPTIAAPTQVVMRREADTFVFTAQGDETIEWRYTPQTGLLTDLAVSVAGRAPFTPCATAGPVLFLKNNEYGVTDPSVTRSLQSIDANADSVTTTWRGTVNGDSTSYRITLQAKGKSLLVDWASDEAKVTSLQLGKATGLMKPRVQRVPYLNIENRGPGVLVDNGAFCSVLLDWYNTESSSFFGMPVVATETSAVLSGGSNYYPLTDGTRNPLGERLFINVSSRFNEVLPNIPNPPSTQDDMMREHLYCHIGGIDPQRFDRYMEMWQTFHRKGVREVRVSHHEDAWTNGADVGQGGQEYTMCIEAAPEVGDEKLMAYCQAMRKMDYYIGLYENFTDYNPLGKSWDIRNCTRNSNGEIIRVWPPTYAIRPLKALDMALLYPRLVASKFHTNTAYRDCATAYPPWGQVDFQAGTPGAGKFATNFKAWGALLMDGHKAYNGPIFSEGINQWFMAGLVDGNYAQCGIFNEEPPLLMDFDLQKIHPLEADISMTPGWYWGPEGMWSGLAATIAYGHMGFLPFDNYIEGARYYYLIQQLQSRYLMIPTTEITYHKEGVWRDATEAIQEQALDSKQVRVRYENGLEVVVNYNADKPWEIEVGGVSRTLNGFSWAACAPDFTEYCTVKEGRRIGFVDSPTYLFADGGGAWEDFGEIATDGMVALQREGELRGRLIILAPTTRVAMQLPAGSRVEAFDKSDVSLGNVILQPDGEKSCFSIPENTDYLLIR